VNQVRASTAEEAFFTLDPFALEKSNDADNRTLQATDPWFCDLESFFDHRHALSPRLKRLFGAPTSMGNRNLVFAAVIGHKGTGKSTQIRKAITELEPTGIEPAFVDALAALDETNYQQRRECAQRGKNKHSKRTTGSGHKLVSRRIAD
jgi:hypothetical protein